MRKKSNTKKPDDTAEARADAMRQQLITTARRKLALSKAGFHGTFRRAARTGPTYETYLAATVEQTAAGPDLVVRLMPATTLDAMAAQISDAEAIAEIQRHLARSHDDL